MSNSTCQHVVSTEAVRHNALRSYSCTPEPRYPSAFDRPEGFSTRQHLFPIAQIMLKGGALCVGTSTISYHQTASFITSSQSECLWFFTIRIPLSFDWYLKPLLGAV